MPTESPPVNRPRGGYYAGMALTAMSILLFQVALTRVFAITMWHHFAYMVVSLALLGFGASGSLLTALRAGEGRRRFDPGIWATLYGVTVLLAFLAVLRIRVDSLELWNEPANFLGLLATYLVLCVPFLCGGFAIGATLTRHPKHVGGLYFVDLVGSAIGAASAPWLLDAFGSVSTVVIAAFVGLLGGLCFVLPGRGLRPVLHGLPAVAGLGVVLAFNGALPGVERIEIDVPPAPNKGLQTAFPGGKPAATLHSAIAQIDVSEPIEWTMSIGGQFGDVDWMKARLRGITQDATAPSVVYENGRAVENFPALDDTNAAAAYRAMAARGGSEPRVCVIGVGGGPDLMVALFHDARAVTGVEINDAMLRVLREDFKEFSGHLIDDPRIELVNADGRSFLKRPGEPYDIIQLSGVDTFTALSTGAYTLSESYLYTEEAVRDLYRRLAPDGYVCYSRFLLQPPLGPRETIRLANIARSALRKEGVEEPWRNILILQAHGWASTLIKRGAFTEAESRSLREWAALENFRGLVADPWRPVGGPYDEGRLSNVHFRTQARATARRLEPAVAARPELQAALGVEDFVEALGVHLRARFEGRVQEAENLLSTFLAPVPETLRETVRGIIDEDYARAAEEWRKIKRRFEGMQVAFEKILRTSDEDREAFMASHPYDLSVITDDEPFFFDYFKWSSLWGGGDSEEESNRGWSADHEYHPGFPVGQLVLWSSLVQIGLLAFVLILLPLRRLERQSVGTQGRGRIFVYFAALGLGFMFIEISLMQRFILLLGHPTYAVSVVLGGILLFSGLGALASTRVRRPGRLTFAVLGVLIATLVLIAAYSLDDLVARAFGLSLAGRVGATLAMIAPLGFLLGFPFPLGIRVLDETRPVLIPWGWAINGFLSVFSSLLATVVAMEAGGFTVVLVLAAIVYLVGCLLLPTRRPETAAA